MSNLWRCMHGGGGTVCCHWGLRGGGAPPECKKQPRRKGLHPGVQGAAAVATTRQLFYNAARRVNGEERFILQLLKHRRERGPCLPCAHANIACLLSESR